MIRNAREYLEDAEYRLEERNDHLKAMDSNMNKEVPKDEVLNEKNPEEDETLRRKQSEERRMNKKNEQILTVKKERISEILKRDPNIKLRKKKLKDYKDNDIELIEMDDLIEQDREVDQAEKDKRNAWLLKEFRKIDYFEREARKVQNSKIKNILETKHVDVSLLEENAQKLYEYNVNLRSTIIKAKAFKDKYSEDKLKQRHEEYISELTEFQEKITEKYAKKIIDKATEKALRIKTEKAELEEARRKEEELRNKRQAQDENNQNQRQSYRTEGLVKRGAEFGVAKEHKEEQPVRPERATGLVSRGAGITQKQQNPPIQAQSGGGGLTRGGGIANKNEGNTGGLTRGTLEGKGTLGGPTRNTGGLQRGVIPFNKIDTK